MIDRGFTTVRDTGGADWGIKTGVEQGHVPGRASSSPARRSGRPGPFGSPPAHRFRRPLPLLQRHGVHDGGVGWGIGGAQGGPRADASGRRPREDHDVGRRRLALRSARFAPVQPAGGRRGGRGGAGFRPLCLRPRLYAGGDHARRACGGSHDRARQPHRRAFREAYGREGHDPDRQPRRLLCDARARGRIRHDLRHARQERPRHRRGLRSLEICKRAGVPVAYGSDLLGALQIDQNREFLLRGDVVSPIEIIRSATTIGAKVLRMEGKLGTLQAGAFADLILIDGDPLKISSCSRPGPAPRGDHEGRPVPQEPAELAHVDRLTGRTASRSDRRPASSQRAPARELGARRNGGHVARLHPLAACAGDLAGLLPPGDPVLSAGRVLGALVRRGVQPPQLRRRISS